MINYRLLFTRAGKGLSGVDLLMIKGYCNCTFTGEVDFSHVNSIVLMSHSLQNRCGAVWPGLSALVYANLLS